MISVLAVNICHVNCPVGKAQTAALAVSNSNSGVQWAYQLY